MNSSTAQNRSEVRSQMRSQVRETNFRKPVAARKPRSKTAAAQVKPSGMPEVEASPIHDVPKMKVLNKKRDVTRLSEDVIEKFVTNRRPSFQEMWTGVVTAAQCGVRIGMLTFNSIKQKVTS